MDLRIGYSGTYWSNVARPGSQIDTTINSKLVPTGAVIINQNQNPPAPSPGAFSPTEEQGRPYFVFRDSAFWAHGINVGVLFRY
jgi:hypothetical protein